MLLNNDQCYALLGLKKGASVSEIREAYRKLALEYHPDKNISAKDGTKFKLITEAYQTLRVKNDVKSPSTVYQNQTTVVGTYEKAKSLNFYLHVFRDVVDYAQKIKHVQTVCKYLSKSEPAFFTCYTLGQKHIANPLYRLMRFSYGYVGSISHMSYRKLVRDMLKYLGLHS